jgi:hypothetical protein
MWIADGVALVDLLSAVVKASWEQNIRDQRGYAWVEVIGAQGVSRSLATSTDAW